MPESENKSPEPQEPSPAQPQSNGTGVMPPNFGLREVNATYEMLVNFKEAILHNMWPGDKVQAVAMGLQMVATMEGQYRGQVEKLRRDEKAMRKQAEQAIANAGGQINGAPSPEPDPLSTPS